MRLAPCHQNRGAPQERSACFVAAQTRPGRQRRIDFSIYVTGVGPIHRMHEANSANLLRGSAFAADGPPPQRTSARLSALRAASAISSFERADNQDVRSEWIGDRTEANRLIHELI